MAAWDHVYFGFYRHFWIFYTLLALTFFLMCWGRLRSSFKLGTWVPSSGIACIAVALILTATTTVNPERFNQVYVASFEYVHGVIDVELKRAEELYAITYDEREIELLRLWRGHDAFSQMDRLQKKFAQDQPVEMSDIILQRILIRIGKDGYNEFWDPWPHARPEDIYRHITYYEPGEPEVFEMFKIIQYMILINNLHFDGHMVYDTDDTFYAGENPIQVRNHYHLTGGNYFHFRDFKIHETREMFLANPKYSEYHHLLPEVKFEYIFRW